jgi:PAS domain-containing protein
MDDDVASVHSNLKADEMERIQIKKVELAFDKRSVVFRVNHEIKGKIIQVNRAVYHAFGYTALELSG